MRDDAVKNGDFFFACLATLIILVITPLRIVSDNVCARAFAYI